MELYYSPLSDVGNVRAKNEDFLFAGKIREDDYLFIVADGMGGHSSGEVASYEAVTTFVKSMKKGVGNNISEVLRRIILNINDTLIREGKKVPNARGMGTTLSVLYIKDDLGYIAHVGDSRIYRFTETGLEQLTEDHSLVGRLLKDGYITKEEAQTHPKRNVLFQSIGMKEKIEIQTIGPFPIQKGQQYLLCSDGLNIEVTDAEIEEFLKLKSTRRTAEGLIKQAKKGSATDNITVIAVSTERDKTTQLDDTIKDTVKIKTPEWVKKRRRRNIVVLLLLGLLISLLAAVIYLLIGIFKEESGSGSNKTSVSSALSTVKNSLYNSGLTWQGYNR